MEENKILEVFNNWISQYEEGNGEKKDLLQQRMKGFIVALTLSDNDREATECKTLYDKLTGQ